MPDVSAELPTAAQPSVPDSLSAYTTLRLGGQAQRILVATNADELAQSPANSFILAGGSNVVVGDDDYPGIVVLVRSTGVTVREAEPETVTVTVQAGESWDSVVAQAVDAGWSGIECLSGIPGSAGATPIQNVGAYGQEVAETITAVQALDRTTGERRVMTPEECGFAYRASVFKHSDRWVVLSVDFRLARSPESAPVRYAELARALGVEIGQRVPLADARAAVLALRAGKGMVLDPSDPDTRSVGSFFTNPVLEAAAYTALLDRANGVGEPPSWPGPDGVVKVSAAWLIDKAGFTKGYGSGPVGISTKHTLALTHRGDGSTAELLGLAREIRDGVKNRFGVTLHPEPVLVNCEL
ncbi:UDP-N-acetylmuramate dehydrogenase [Phytohabitans flavus]|uniref:UDP-N-acetylenolpyruvoylglucosamine reductase n=1 Tax=Phytohabitans flavus TaxID=1076124 RepID=A0A6F8Y296_9ACTN|nr:UDP-N-acetylmuramate dehydrogenase [Phytohabitans flavus]BCB80177.1 UDP-N-acetylenolpyruvoylglucosamine reductase [Phytohabitans flavus]